MTPRKPLRTAASARGRGATPSRGLSAHSGPIPGKELIRRLGELESISYALDQSAILVVTDRKGIIRAVNDKFLEISGYSREELLGKTHKVVSSGLHPRSFYRDLWRTIDEGRVWRGEIRNRAKDGTYYWLDTTITPLAGPSGRPWKYLGIRWPVSDRKATEESLRSIFNAVEHTADAVFVTGREGDIQYVNPAFTAITGYSREEAVGSTPRILKSGVQDREYYRGLWKRILSGKVHRAMVVNRKKNGDLFYAEQTITPIRDSAGQITQFVSVVKDMTERRKLEAQKIEMELAGRIQQKLYPQESPRLAGVDLTGAVFPAGQGCGDYFDFISMGEGSVGIAIGDVAGHGVGPALLMAEARAYLRSIARTHSDPCDVLNEVNAALAPDMADNLYITLLLARLEMPAGRLVCANAGHTEGYLLDRNGSVKAVLASTGPPLGMFQKTVYRAGLRFDLAPGEIAFLLTDGLVESEGPEDEEFGVERAIAAVRRHRRESAQEIIRHVHRAVRRFRKQVGQRDDITLVVCKRETGPAPAGPA